MKDNLPLEEVSREIEVSIATILGYVAAYLDRNAYYDFKIDTSKYYNEEDREAILKAISECGKDKISLVKAKLSDSIKYEAIRAIILEEYYLDRE